MSKNNNLIMDTQGVLKGVKDDFTVIIFNIKKIWAIKGLLIGCNYNLTIETEAMICVIL